MNKKEIVIFLITGFILNLIWEILHSQLYTCCINSNVISILPTLVIAAVKDAIIISIIFLVSSFFKGSKTKVSFIILTGIVWAHTIEKIALSSGKWAYTPSMPIVLGVGITPLVQLATTALISMYLVGRLIIAPATRKFSIGK